VVAKLFFQVNCHEIDIDGLESSFSKATEASPCVLILKDIDALSSDSKPTSLTKGTWGSCYTIDICCSNLIFQSKHVLRH
jgi:hypothetical protein